MNSSAPGLFSTCIMWIFLSNSTFSKISLLCEKGLKAEWTRVSSRSKIKVFLPILSRDWFGRNLFPETGLGFWATILFEGETVEPLLCSFCLGELFYFKAI